MLPIALPFGDVASVVVVFVVVDDEVEACFCNIFCCLASLQDAENLLHIEANNVVLAAFDDDVVSAVVAVVVVVACLLIL